MTGLDLKTDALVEVAVLVTDAELQVLGEGVDLVIRPPDEALAQMSDVVRSMHTSSGLLEALAHGISLTEARDQILRYVTTYVPEAGKAPLAGNTVHMDRLFLARDLPDVEAHLHYRNVDVSSIKELARRWFPRVYFAAPPKIGNHRALGDIQDSIEELRYYRRTIFVPEPGPDTETARAVAREIIAARPEGSVDRSPEQVPMPPEAVAE
jgi:oligoribonuclease